jgi:predicted GNAT family acetyltransferase
VRVAGRPAYERHIESVWVDPRYRRTGVLRAVLAELWAVDPEVTDWRVWVLDTNAVARQVYDRLGFTPTGESQLLEDGSGRREIRLRFCR